MAQHPELDPSSSRGRGANGESIWAHWSKPTLLSVFVSIGCCLSGKGFFFSSFLRCCSTSILYLSTWARLSSRIFLKGERASPSAKRFIRLEKTSFELFIICPLPIAGPLG